jgi:hypothetical protein
MHRGLGIATGNCTRVRFSKVPLSHGLDGIGHREGKSDAPTPRTVHSKKTAELQLNNNNNNNNNKERSTL